MSHRKHQLPLFCKIYCIIRTAAIFQIIDICRKVLLPCAISGNGKLHSGFAQQSAFHRRNPKHKLCPYPRIQQYCFTCIYLLPIMIEHIHTCLYSRSFLRNSYLRAQPLSWINLRRKCRLVSVIMKLRVLKPGLLI